MPAKTLIKCTCAARWYAKHSFATEFEILSNSASRLAAPKNKLCLYRSPITPCGCPFQATIAKQIPQPLYPRITRTLKNTTRPGASLFDLHDEVQREINR